MQQRVIKDLQDIKLDKIDLSNPIDKGNYKVVKPLIKGKEIYIKSSSLTTFRGVVCSSYKGRKEQKILFHCSEGDMFSRKLDKLTNKLIDRFMAQNEKEAWSRHKSYRRKNLVYYQCKDSSRATIYTNVSRYFKAYNVNRTPLTLEDVSECRLQLKGLFNLAFVITEETYSNAIIINPRLTIDQALVESFEEPDVCLFELDD